MNTTLRVGIAIVFTLIYVSLYPVLTGRFVIYVYPSWSSQAAIAWIAGGMLVQAGFCFPRVATSSRVATQVGVGLVYALSLAVFSGGCYQS